MQIRACMCFLKTEIDPPVSLFCTFFAESTISGGFFLLCRFQTKFEGVVLNKAHYI